VLNFKRIAVCLLAMTWMASSISVSLAQTVPVTIYTKNMSVDSTSPAIVCPYGALPDNPACAPIALKKATCEKPNNDPAACASCDTKAKCKTCCVDAGGGLTCNRSYCKQSS
jgi:hypothetical protein